MDEEQTPPVCEGDVLENQEVINNGKKDDGVVKYEGYIIFVNDCEKGDIVSLKMDKVMPSFGIGIKIED